MHKMQNFIFLKIINIIDSINLNLSSFLFYRILIVFWMSLKTSPHFSKKIQSLKTTLSRSLLCSYWSENPVCCDWSTLLGLVR